MFDNFLPKALFLSLTIHTIFICSSLLVHLPHQQRVVKSRGIEVTYKPQMKKKAPDVRERPIKPAQQLDLKKSIMNPIEGSVPLKLGGEKEVLKKDFMMVERRREQIKSAQIINKVSVKQINSQKANNPAFALYSSMVRNLIENKVYENYSKKMEAGSLYITFMIAQNGTLKAVQIIEEKTNASQDLRDSSLKSFQEAKFPPFLAGMTLPEYTFNIEIQYQVRE